jgi:photosystem II stability/assembly factor-like uncharacterized protein
VAVRAFSSYLLLVTVLFGFDSPVSGQNSKPPFDLSWGSGLCRNCEVVRQLGQVQFTGQQTIWAVGYYFPTEGEGAGDNSIVHSSDSGRHWTELAKTRMHATEPSLSFLDRRRGWISGMGWDASPWVLRTSDGGAHWTKISNHFIQSIQFISANVGVGTEFDGKTDLFAKTIDGGRTWSTSRIPNVKFINKLFFISPEVGWIAGTNDASDDLNGRVAVVLRTTDGGANWASFQIPSREGVADVRDLYFFNDEIGWLITWHYNNNGTHLYRTSDGGRSWTVHPDVAIQGAGRWLSVVRFVDPNIGFAFSRDDKVETVNDLNVAAVVANPETGPTQSGRLLYSNDGGEHWSGQPIRALVYDCQIIGHGLGCSASRDKRSFSILRVTVMQPGRMSR